MGRSARSQAEGITDLKHAEATARSEPRVRPSETSAQEPFAPAASVDEARPTRLQQLGLLIVATALVLFVLWRVVP